MGCLPSLIAPPTLGKTFLGVSGSPLSLLLSVEPGPPQGGQKSNLADRGSERRTPWGIFGEVVRGQAHNPLPGYNGLTEPIKAADKAHKLIMKNLFHQYEDVKDER